MLQVPAGICGAGHGGRHLPLQRPDCVWESRGFLRAECGRLLGVSPRRDAPLPEGARRSRQLCDPRNHSEVLELSAQMCVPVMEACKSKPTFPSGKQEAVHELRLHCGKGGDQRGTRASTLSEDFPSSWVKRDDLLFALQVLHYVEKPSTFVSDIINCGIYLFHPEIFQHIGAVFQKNQQDMLL